MAHKAKCKKNMTGAEKIPWQHFLPYMKLYTSGWQWIISTILFFFYSSTNGSINMVSTAFTGLNLRFKGSFNSTQTVIWVSDRKLLFF